MDEHKIAGIHCVFYYYGVEHLIVNVYDYITKGIEKNELVYLCMEPKIHKDTLSYLERYNTQIQPLNISYLINAYNNKDMKCLLKDFSNYERAAKEKGYTGIRIVNQVNYLLKNISNDQLLSFDNLLNEIAGKLNISIMCAYDFDDYVNKKQLVNDALIKQSFKVHNHRFYNFKIIENTEYI